MSVENDMVLGMAPFQQGNGFSTEGVIQAIAALIALAALTLAIWEGVMTRRHNRLSVKPHLQLAQHLRGSKGRLGISLSNAGLGPAIVTNCHVEVDGQLMPSNDGCNGWKTAASTLELEDIVEGYETIAFDPDPDSDEEIPGVVMEAGETKWLLSAPIDEKARAGLEMALPRVQVVVSYQSMYGEKSTVELWRSVKKGGKMAEDKSEAVKVLYEQVCSSHNGIADFRAKLLALLPLASGVGIFLLVGDTPPANEILPLLLPVGVFGVLITIGLFLYELRNLQQCNAWIACAKKLEKELSPELCELGAFSFRPKAVLWEAVSNTWAALVIYPTVIGAWVYVAGVGLTQSLARNSTVLVVAAGATVGVFALGWAVDYWQDRRLKQKLAMLK
jgi:hypothetical protein